MNELSKTQQVPNGDPLHELDASRDNEDERSPDDTAYDWRFDQEMCKDTLLTCKERSELGSQSADVYLRRRRIVRDLRCIQQSPGETMFEYIDRTCSPEKPSTLARQISVYFETAKGRDKFWRKMQKEIDAWLLEVASTGKFPEVRIAENETPAPELMQDLAVEWLRDKKAFRAFFTRVFDRWKNFDGTQSARRISLVIHQIADACGHNAAMIQEHLQSEGLMSKHNPKDPSEQGMHEAQLAKIRQMISREPKLAGGNKM